MNKHVLRLLNGRNFPFGDKFISIRGPRYTGALIITAVWGQTKEYSSDWNYFAIHYSGEPPESSVQIIKKLRFEYKYQKDPQFGAVFDRITNKNNNFQYSQSSSTVVGRNPIKIAKYEA